MKWKQVYGLLCLGAFLSLSLGSAAFAEETANVVNPVGKVLFADQPVLSDEEGSYIAIGDQLKLRAGGDGEFETGDEYVEFGNYPQAEGASVDDPDSYEPLKWYLLDEEDGAVTMITEKTLVRLPFNTNSSEDAGLGNDWSTSNLRSWLNSYEGGVDNTGDTTGFYDTAFSDEEKEMIQLSSVSMSSSEKYWAFNTLLKDYTDDAEPSSDGNQYAYGFKNILYWEEWSTDLYGYEDTEDYVYALSGEEAFLYFGTKGDGEEEIASKDQELNDWYAERISDDITNGADIPDVWPVLESLGVTVDESTYTDGESSVGYGGVTGEDSYGALMVACNDVYPVFYYSNAGTTATDYCGGGGDYWSRSAGVDVTQIDSGILPGDYTSDMIQTRTVENEDTTYSACYHGTFINPGGSINVGRPVDGSYGARPVIQVMTETD